MTACGSYREDLMVYLDLELTASARREVEDHLSGCAGCSRELERLRQLGDSLAALPQIEPSPRFTARFWARLARESDARLAISRLWDRLSLPRLVLGLGGAAAVAAVALLLMRAPADPDPDWVIVADSESYELLQEGDLELLDVLEILEAWDGSEDL